MTLLAKKLTDQVLSLPCEDRVIVAEKLLQSLNSPMQSEVDQAWCDEVERRIDEIDSGNVELIPGEEVFWDIRKRLGK